MTLFERLKQFIRNDNLDDERDYVTLSSPQSAVGSSQLAVGSSQSAVGSSQSAVGSSQSAVGNSQSAVGNSQIVESVHSEPRIQNQEPRIQNSEFGIQNSEPRTKNPESRIQNSEPLPHWLENEDALRDEGVIFGLSESKAEEKTAIIRNVFAYQTADLEKEVEEYNEKIGEFNLFIEQKELRINELTEKARILEEKERKIHQLPRTLAGLLLSLAMCIGNYYLIAETLKSSYQQNYQFIAVGIFLAGMFNLFGRISFFHEQDTSLSWRRMLEEIGMPLAASAFVFVHSLETQSTLRAFALLFFVFFLFLFAGKLLLSNMTITKDDLSIWLDNQRLSNDKINKSADWEEGILKLKNEIDELRIKKWEIIPTLNKAQAELTRINGKRDALIKLFESEFNLARSYRDKLTAKDLKEIIR
jgi:hypothetical protein